MSSLSKKHSRGKVQKKKNKKKQKTNSPKEDPSLKLLINKQLDKVDPVWSNSEIHGIKNNPLSLGDINNINELPKDLNEDFDINELPIDEDLNKDFDINPEYMDIFKKEDDFFNKQNKLLNYDLDKNEDSDNINVIRLLLAEKEEKQREKEDQQEGNLNNVEEHFLKEFKEKKKEIEALIKNYAGNDKNNIKFITEEIKNDLKKLFKEVDNLNEANGKSLKVNIELPKTTKNPKPKELRLRF